MIEEKKNCKKCDEPISSKAKICPLCRTKNPHIGAKEQAKGCAIIVLVFIVLGVIGNLTGSNEESENSQLGATEPAVVEKPDLDKILLETPLSWIEELRIHSPAEYKKIISTKELLISEYSEEVRSLPASDVLGNLTLYATLFALDPENKRYREKYHHYTGKHAEREWINNNCNSSKESEVGFWAKEYVKRNLKAPRSAKFPWLVDAQHIGNCQFKVNSWVDAENSFGAMIRTNYVIILEYSRQGDWKVIDYATY